MTAKAGYVRNMLRQHSVWDPYIKHQLIAESHQHRLSC